MAGAEPEKSVVRITTFTQQPVFDAPWRFESVRRASGSGFVIRGKRILTNAHVVSWARQLVVYRYQDPRPYLARPIFIGHDCDLAVLEVENPDFFEGMEALEIGELPKVRSTVVTYGYPAGGEQISYTKGVVSRVEVQAYAHIGNRAFLAVQTDAAINPGNSGGPVIQDDKVAGVAFQGMSGLENAGFFIPQPVIQHFLRDVEDGKLDGIPELGLRLVALQNQTYRKFLGLPDNDLGARVDYLYPELSAAKVLRPDDVLLQAGAYPIASDCTIIYQGNRVNVSAAFGEYQRGEAMPLKLWRQGRETNVSVTFGSKRLDQAEGNQYVLPRYYIFGGLVFTPLSLDYLRSFGANWADATSAELRYELFFRRMETPDKARPEPIVLATILSHDVNANFSIRGRALIDSINGIRIEKMEDVVRAFESSTNAQDAIEFVTQHNLECLNHAEAKAANAGILSNNNIKQDRRL